MINTNVIDPSKKCFKGPQQKLILLEDEEFEHQTLRNLIVASNKIIPNEDRSFILFDFGAIISQYTRIRNLIPRAYPFFAIKCMADKQIISLLGSLGSGFDCASWDEITNASLALPKPSGTFSEKYHPLNSEKIIFSHPFKFVNEMVKASKIGVEFTVFDTEEELLAISKYWPQAKLLLRILPPKQFKAYAQLGKKFGADFSEAKALILNGSKLNSERKRIFNCQTLFGVNDAIECQGARTRSCSSMDKFDLYFILMLNLTINIFSFHVGSGVEEIDAWSQCIEYSAKIFQIMEKEGYKPYLLDIGGGFPSMSMINSAENTEYQHQFGKECQNINMMLDKYFPVSENYVIICEPGAYFTSGSGCLFCQIIGKIEEKNINDQINIDKMTYPNVKYSYILNNSSYHTVEYNAGFDVYSVKEFHLKEKLINLQNDVDKETKLNSRFLGYTVDEFDCIIPEIQIPELAINDWLALVDKGAYTDVHNELPTIFCSTTAIPHYYCITKKHLSALKSIISKCNNNNNKVLKMTNRNDIFDSISENCLIM
uniref:Ornithine decarboxylase-1 n=1 Tax=Schmidtea mediterranea TaxID=79327 RepID=I1ZIA8_SCHMD|nr:ornithine decarboxylase-1 [Schmidtea mediterranea]